MALTVLRNGSGEILTDSSGNAFVINAASAFTRRATSAPASGLRTLGSGATSTYAFGAAVLAGSMLVLDIANYPSGIASVTDSLGNTWQKAVTFGDGGENFAEIWWVASSAAGTPTLTITPASTTDNFLSGFLTEYTVTGGTPTLDRTGTVSASGGTTTVSTSAATTAADELAHTVAVIDASTPDAFFSLPADWRTVDVEDDSSTTTGYQAGEQFTPAAGTISVTHTHPGVTSGVDAVIATWKVAASGTYNGAGAETAAATEAQAATAALAQAQAETAAATEAQAGTMTATAARAESAAVSDSSSATAAGDYNAVGADAAAVADSSASAAAPTAARAESAAIADASDAVASGAWLAAGSDSAAAADTQAATPTATQAVAESTAVADTTDAIAANYQAAVSEATAAADAASAAQVGDAAVVESAAATDTTNALPAGAYEASIAESVGVTDAAQAVSDNVPDDLDVRLIGGGNVKFKPIPQPGKKRELPLAADITNMPDAPAPASRYELGILAALAMNTPLPEAPAAPVPVSRKEPKSAPVSRKPAPVPPAPAPEPAAPAPAAPAPAVNLEELIGVVTTLMDGREERVQKQLDAMAAELAAAQQRLREMEIERQVADIEARIIARRTTNAQRAEEIVRKIMNGH